MRRFLLICSLMVSSYGVAYGQQDALDHYLELQQSMQPNSAEWLGAELSIAESYDSLDPLVTVSKAKAVLARIKDTDQPGLIARAKTMIGLGLVRAGKIEESKPFLIEAIEDAKALGDQNILARAYRTMGIYYYYASNSDQAVYYYKLSNDISREIGDLVALSTGEYNVGLEILTNGYYEDALKSFDEAEATARKSFQMTGNSQDLKVIAYINSSRGTAYNMLAEYEKAISALQKSIEQSKEMGDYLSMVDAHYFSGALRLKIGEDERVLKEVDDFFATATMTSFPEYYHRYALLQTQAWLNLGNSKEAEIAANQAKTWARDYGDVWAELAAMRLLARIYKDQGKDENALSQALEYIEMRNTADPDYIDGETARTNQTMETVVANMRRERAQLLAETESGRVKWLLVLAIVFAVAFVWIWIVDRSRRKANITLQERSELLAESNAELNRIHNLHAKLLSNTSYDMRSPINSVLGLSSMLAKEPNIQRRQKEILWAIQNAGNTILSLTDDVLELSGSQLRSLPIKNQQVDVRHWVENLVYPFTVRAEAKSLIFTFAVGESLPEQLILPTVRIGQIITNFLERSFDNTKAGYISCIAIVDNRADGPLLYIEVEDSSKGVSQAIIDEALQQSETSVHETLSDDPIDVDPTDADSALRKSLNSCKDLANSIGAKIGVKNVDSAGAKYWISMPLAGNNYTE